jgi:DNA-binding beta-propeller fold protein YncE
MLRFSKITMTTLLLLLMSFIPFTAQSEVDWEISSAIQLDETPIDVARAQGGELTFLLTDQAKVLIYSAAGKLLGTIPVDPSVTDIAISAKGEQLYLINSKRKTLKTVDVSFIVDFIVAGSPFLGPADAKVVVAVFSDFQ